MEDLDAIDCALLAEVQDDGRATNVELGERVGLSPSAVLRRLRRLEELGVVAGWHARLDPARVGHGLDVFVEITLTGQTDALLDAFETAVADCPNVVSCHLMAGDADYLVHLAVRDVADFERIHRSNLSGLPGVLRMESRFALRRVFAASSLVVTPSRR